MFKNDILSKKLARNIDQDEMRHATGRGEFYYCMNATTCRTDGGGDDYSMQRDMFIAD